MSFLGYNKVEVGNQEVNNLYGKSFAYPFQESKLLVQNLGSYLYNLGLPGNEQLNDFGKDTRESLELTNYYYNNPLNTTGQKFLSGAISFGASFIEPGHFALGSGLGAIGGTALGYAGKKIANNISPLVSEYLAPNVIKKFFRPVLPKSLENVSRVSGHSAGGFIGFGLPENVNENYDEKTSTFKMMPLIKQSAIEGGIGLSIPIVFFAIAHVHGKIFGDGLSKSDRDIIQSLENKFRNKEIPSEEYEFYKSTILHPEEREKHIDLAHKILKKDKIIANRHNGNFIFPLNSTEEYENFQKMYLDHLALDAEDPFKERGMHYAAHGVIDRINETYSSNPHFTNTIRSYINISKDLLKRNPFEYEKFVNRLKKTDRWKIDEERSIYSMERAKNKKDIHYFDGRAMVNRNYVRKNRFFDTGIPDEIKAKDFKYALNGVIHTPDYASINSELVRISNSLFSKKKAFRKGSFNYSKDYLTLSDLAQYSTDANYLKELADLKYHYDLQDSYHKILDNIATAIDNQGIRSAKIEDILSYMKNRVEKMLPYESEPYFVKPMEVKEVESEKIIDDLAYQKINDSNLLTDEEKLEFNDISAKIADFERADTEEVLFNTIKCLEGLSNG